ncbi:MAG: nuclear transport factor 2 family protein [Burkholderiales bacterium]|nr:nuclear transport factor 2 family protein [Anaerolineae bacterium]
MIDAAWAKDFAQEWVEAWNSHDLDRIFAHFTDDFEMTSPLIVQRGYEASGTLHGKNAVRPYWQAGLDALPPLRFELIDVLIGVNSITIYFRQTSGKLAAEVLIFNDQGQVVKGIAHHTMQ